MNWFMRLFRRRALERDLQREVAFHLDAHTRDLVRLGATPGDGAREARRAFGNVDQMKEAARDARGTRWLEDWWTDTLYALRTMRRTPAFTAAAILTLALGIGANGAVWNIVDALVMRSLPIREPEQLYALKRVGNENSNDLMSHARFRLLQSELPATSSLAAMTTFTRAYVTVGERLVSANMQLVSGEWFPMLGVRAGLGRVFNAADTALGGVPMVVLSDAYWARQFGRDSSVVGSTLRVNGAPVTVIGVAAAGFGGLTVGQSVDLWAPVAMQHELKYQSDSRSVDSDTERPWVPQAGIQWLTLIARVDGNDIARAGPALDRRFRADVEVAVAGSDSADRAYAMREHVTLESMRRGVSPLRAQFADPLRMLALSVGLILLITCGNLAGLLLARGASRTHEFAVRVSLGARPGRLVRQLLTESVTLAMLGGALSLAFAYWGSYGLVRTVSGGPRLIPLDITLNAKIIALALATALVTGVLFGLAPALRVARANLYDSFKTGGRVQGAVRGTRRLVLGRTLVVSQIAMSLVLVISASVFVRSFQNLMSLDPGFEAERVVTARVDVRSAGYSFDQLPSLHQRLLNEVSRVPGVQSASLSMNGLGGGGRRTSSFEVPGRELAPGTDGAQENFVTPKFFTTTGFDLYAGRAFSDADRDGTPRVAIVSEAMARHFFGEENPVGRRFGYGSSAEFEVVGVVRDAVVNNNLREVPPRLVFYPLAQGPQEFVTSIEARVTGNTAPVIAGMRDALASVDRQLPVREVVVLRDLLTRGLWRERIVARLAGVFGVLALLLAAVGLYGVMAHMVSRRTNEMGVRIALGAMPSSVRWLVLRDSLLTVSAGIVIGIALSIPLLRFARGFVYGLSPRDPSVAAVAAVLIAIAGVLATLVPAWRASRVDPLKAIRAE